MNLTKFNEILDLATETATQALIEEVSPTQISNLLAVLESTEEEKNIPLLKVYIARQKGRKKIGEKTAQLLISGISKLQEDRDNVRIYLGLVKWVMDAYGKKGEERKKPSKPHKKFEDALNDILGGEDKNGDK